MSEPRQTAGSARLDVAWTVAPVAVLVAILALTSREGRAPALTRPLRGAT